MNGRKFKFANDPFTGRTNVTFDYDAELVDTIKRIVPHRHRSYNADTRTWSMDWIYGEDVRQAFIRIEMRREHAANEEYARRQHQHNTSSSSNAPVALEDVFTALFRALPDELAPKAHKALVRTCHPDVGGDHEVSVALNRAWDKAVAA